MAKQTSPSPVVRVILEQLRVGVGHLQGLGPVAARVADYECLSAALQEVADDLRTLAFVDAALSVLEATDAARRRAAGLSAGPEDFGGAQRL
jgi:hypothetical protein